MSNQNDNNLERTKNEISNKIKGALLENNLSIRKLAQNVGMQHPQVLRVTGGQNYTIHNLIKILDELGLCLKVVKKENTTN